ncbi:MAG: hypothetical protein AAF570_20345, partial [Bacteroidota bacterium]
MNEERDILLIAAYLDDELNTEERAEFEQRLAAEPALGEALELEKEVRAVVVYAERRRLKAALQAFDAEMNGADTPSAETTAESEPSPNQEISAEAESEAPKTIPFRRNPRRLWLMGSAVAAILVAAVFLFLPGSNPREAIFDDHFAGFKAPGSSRSDQAQRDSAFAAYDAGRFADALKFFESVKDTGKARIESQFFEGVARIETGDYTGARAPLLFVKQKGDQLYSHPAWYFAALVHYMT